MKLIKTIDAVGQVLCHDITQIIPGEFKGRKFKKGHIVKEEDIPVLLSLGKDNLYVWEKSEGMVHENEGALFLKELTAGENLDFSEIKEGKIDFIAACDGLLKIDVDALFDLNCVGEIMMATLHNNFIVNKNTIKGKILNYNISIIIMLIALTAIIFNLSINLYIQKDIKNQLNTLASNAKNTVLINSPDFFPNNNIPPKPPKFNQHQTNNQDNIETDKNIVPPSDPSENQNNISSHLYSDNNDSFKYYLMLDRSLKEPLTLLNANFILLDENQNTITPLHENFDYSAIIEEISSKNSKAMRLNETTYVNFDFSDNKYMAVIQPIADKDFSFLGWIIIYSNVQKMQELKFYINIILLLILISSAFITVIFSSKLSKNISKPLSDLNEQISSISDRNFGNKIQIPVFDELDELVNNINSMSEKLGDYDKAQKIFLENMSHEFRTPLMSIQSYAEGIKYSVIDNDTAVEVILGEINRMKILIEDLLYLSRLNAIEENYKYSTLNFNEIIVRCIERMNLIVEKNNITISFNLPEEILYINGDEEKLSRAITNIITNCVRYANSLISINLIILGHNKIQLTISDDGTGFDTNDFSNIFKRFYKGSKGNFGLGLSISKNIIEQLGGTISARNLEKGAIFTIILPLL